MFSVNRMQCTLSAFHLCRIPFYRATLSRAASIAHLLSLGQRKSSLPSSFPNSLAVKISSHSHLYPDLTRFSGGSHKKKKLGTDRYGDRRAMHPHILLSSFPLIVTNRQTSSHLSTTLRSLGVFKMTQFRNSRMVRRAIFSVWRTL